MISNENEQSNEKMNNHLRENDSCCCSPSYRPLVSLQAPEWLLPLLEPAQWEAPSERGLPQPPRLPLTLDDEHSAAWLELAKVAEADALLSLLGLEDCFT